MDPATVIALCKENIQPLRYGRNVAQLGTALRAQEDTDVQQLLLQEKQMYEDAIRNYEGDDPLESWYDYILWMEQSYPKSGHESHIGKLLQQCLTTFEKETKYYQDQRYIRLWINYISMQRNPLELYQLLHNNGIGTMVADMYRAWAFELEQIEDYKRADEIYQMGLRARAEPIDELDYAHKNFQSAVARKTLGHMDDRCEASIFEQRQAFSSLKAIKAGKKIGSIRTGHRVRDYYPGHIPQVTSTMQSARSNTRIQIYQNDMPGEMKGASILDHVPIEDTMHKENTIKPGPWNNGNKRSTLLPSVKSAFKVHEDQAEDHLQKVRLLGTHVPFFDGRFYPEHKTIPVYVPEAPDPGVVLRPHYPKDLVYENNMDYSLEELRARSYLLRHNLNMQKKYLDSNIIEDKCPRNIDLQSQQKNVEPQNHSITLQELQHQRQQYLQEKMAHRHQNLGLQRTEVEHLEMERHRIQIEQKGLQRQQYEVEKQTLENQRQQEAKQQELKRLEAERLEAERIEAERIEAQRIEAERIEAQRIEAERIEAQRIEAERLEAQRIEAERLEAQRIEAERLEAQRIEAERIEAERIEAERIEAERIEAERIEAQRMEAELNTQRKLQSSYLHPHHASSLSADSEEHLLGQSLTVNTKEAISVVQNLWHSPGNTPVTPRFHNPIPSRMTDSRTKLSFDIHMDSSITQHAMSSKHHQGYNITPYNDQENHQSYHTPHQGYAAPGQHTPYGNHGLQNTYHYQLQHHDQQVQQLSHHQHHQLMQPHQAHSLHHQSISTSQHLQSHTQLPHHHSSHSQHLQHHHHQQHHTHHHMQQMQHPAFSNMLPNDLGYQQYPSSMESTLLQQSSESQKSLHYPPYSETNIETNKPYRMPPELPYIKSPGMNRRDLKYLENAENKENAIVVDYNGPLEENMPLKPEENNLYADDALGIAPLTGPNDTCYTDACNAVLSSSTPIATNHFRHMHRSKDVPQFPNQNVPQQTIPDAHNGNVDERLSVIMESTREYVSGSSVSSGNTRSAAALGFTLTREEMSVIKESGLDHATNDSIISSNQPYEQKMRAQIQAVHAQSPRTVQRNVDQITSEIKNNCDLRKSIDFKLSSETDNQEKSADTMECEEHEPMEEVEEEIFQLPSGDINPFDKNLIAGLLKKIKFPQTQHADGYVRINTNLNKFVPSTMITLGSEAYSLEKCLGKGMYGTVFKAVNLQTGQTVALKTQKPAWVWEYYIVREIKTRLTNPHMLRGFMDVPTAYIANNGSVLVSEFSKFGTLLAVTNQVKMSTGKPLIEPLAIFFTIEMLQIVEHLHKCQIIHGDIKPDNFLLMRLPIEDVRPTIQLIDFGCSIDMSLLPEKTTFTHIIKTEEFTCIEMQTGKPWTYQTDLYCLAATGHCLLFGNYMRVSNVGDHWFINSKLPRYAKKTAWKPFFTELLNIESCEKLPDLCRLRNLMEEALPPVPELQSKLRILSNILNKR